MENITDKEYRMWFDVYPQPTKHYDKILKREIEIAGEWKCNHPLIERAWMTGGSSFVDETKFNADVHILFKNGNRLIYTSENFQDALDTANKFIKNITTN